jgi:hypothetical protein
MITIPKSLKVPRKTRLTTSLHPLYPTDQLTSRGQKKETGEEVSKRVKK